MHFHFSKSSFFHVFKVWFKDPTRNYHNFCHMRSFLMIRAPIESWECPLSIGALNFRKIWKSKPQIIDMKTEKISSRAFERRVPPLWSEFTRSGSRGHVVGAPPRGWYTVFFSRRGQIFLVICHTYHSILIYARGKSVPRAEARGENIFDRGPFRPWPRPGRDRLQHHIRIWRKTVDALPV
jgi:hypothetical protein